MSTHEKHAWSQVTSPKTHSLNTLTQITNTTSIGTDARQSSSTPLLATIVPIYEAESIVTSLTPTPLRDIGSDSFLKMYAIDLERLSLQAHASAQYQSGGADEYVVEAILTHDKLSVLVRTLLAVEAWRIFVLGGGGGFVATTTEESAGSVCGVGGRLAERLGENGNVLRCAFTLHVETTLVGLLNLVLYRREGCEGIDSDTAIALVDYCSRAMAALATPLDQNPILQRQKYPPSLTPNTSNSDTKTVLPAHTPLEEISNTLLDTCYRTYLSATTLARYLCEHISTLPLSAQTRVLDTHDYLIMLLPLINEPPWTRRRRRRVQSGADDDASSVIWEKWIDNAWKRVPTEDLLVVTKMEAQCWIALHQLTCNNLCRERYALNRFRKEQLLRVRKFLNDVLLDQLPILADVMAYMDQLALMTVPESGSGGQGGSMMLMQQVGVMREGIVNEGKKMDGREISWDEVGEEQFERIFKNVSDGKDALLRLISSEIYSMDGIESIVGEEPLPMNDRVVPVPTPTARSVERVEVNFTINGVLIDRFYLNCLDESTTVVQTPHGSFKRIKMNFESRDEEEETITANMKQMSLPPYIIPSAATITANVIFQSKSKNETKLSLSCSDLKLPTAMSPPTTEDHIEGKVKLFAVPKSLPTVEWRQLGHVAKDKIALQLGFKRIESGVLLSEAAGGADNDPACCCYRCYQAFLSQPEEKL